MGQTHRYVGPQGLVKTPFVLTDPVWLFLCLLPTSDISFGCSELNMEKVPLSSETPILFWAVFDICGVSPIVDFCDPPATHKELLCLPLCVRVWDGFRSEWFRVVAMWHQA